MKALSLLICLFFLAGCVSVQATRLGGGPVRPPVSEHDVVIYRTAEHVKGTYEEVALLDASGDHSMTNIEQMYAKMRKKAGEFGANAIVLDSLSEPTTGAKVANFFLGTPATRKGKAVAIFVAR